MPGGTTSRPSKNRATSARPRSVPCSVFRACLFQTRANSAISSGYRSLAGWDIARQLPGGTEVGIEAANLSRHLAVLRRTGLVTTRKEGSSVFYSLTSPEVAELLQVARRILTGVLSGQAELLEGLRAG